MPPTVPLRLQPLEPREVPANGLFADIVPGIWGSYPHNLTPSGAKLFFAAETSLGNELYVTDGTAAGTKLVKDIRPGRVGSNPARFEIADNGVVYFQADDGTGPALWKSDGTAAGTFKVPDVPAGFLSLEYTSVARNGVLYFSRIDPATQTVQLWKTDGTAPTLLKDFGPTSNPEVDVQGGRVVVTAYVNGVPTQFVTDGTAAGTRERQHILPVNRPETGAGELNYGVEMAPGVFVHRSIDWQGGLFKTSLWTSDGKTDASVRLLKVFDDVSGDASIGSEMVTVGGEVYLVVSNPRTNAYELWATDGTAAGTGKPDLPIAGRLQGSPFREFAGRLLVSTYDDVASRTRYWLTDGTAAGTSEVPLPAAAGAYPSFWGQIPAGPEAPNGLLVFFSAGGFFKTDGTAAGTASIDMTGLGASQRFVGAGLFRVDGAGRPYTESDVGGVYFKGLVFYQTQRDGDVRPELGRWDLATAPPQQPAAPTVLGTVVNGGAPEVQRSSVTSLTVQFDRRVNLEDGAVTVRDSTGKAVLVYLENDTLDGKSVLVVRFGGKSIADGRYTLTVKAGKVTDAATGGPLAADYTVGFHRLYGDLDGDGTYDRAVRMRVKELLGYQAGDPEYDAALDYDGNGKIDAADELEAVRHWGRSV